MSEPIPILFVHHLDWDNFDGEWEAWLPRDFQGFFCDNVPIAYGDTKAEALAELRELIGSWDGHSDDVELSLEMVDLAATAPEGTV